MAEQHLKPAPIFENIEFSRVLECIHCGLCLDACPTYRELGSETDSPRGRLYLMRGLWEGQLQPEKEVLAPLNRCLDCRACESACPTSVPYGHLLEKTRTAVTQNGKGNKVKTFLQRMLFKTAFGSDRWRLIMSKLGRLYQKLGIPQIVLHSPLRHLVPQSVLAAHRVMPRFSGRSFKHSQSKNEPESKKVALFSGCVMDVADLNIHQSTLKLLKALQFEVWVPQSQACCGALHVHRGFQAEAKAFASQNRKVFESENVQTIIVNAAGCGAQLKSYGELFDDHHHWEDWNQKVQDLIVFLASQPQFSSVVKQEPEVTVFYDAPCHLLHAQRQDLPARAFLANLPGVTLVPLTQADVCCGAGGIYNVAQPELATSVLARKMADLKERQQAYPQAKVLLTGNPGCLYQLRAGVEAYGLTINVMHPAEFLASRLSD